MSLLDILFPKQKRQLQAVLNQGAVVIDVRTPQEFRMGKVEGSINIPVDQLNRKLGKIKKYKKPLVLCCESGSRSAAAMGMLRNAGFSEIYNGRTWGRVSRLLSEL